MLWWILLDENVFDDVGGKILTTLTAEAAQQMMCYPRPNENMSCSSSYDRKINQIML